MITALPFTVERDIRLPSFFRLHCLPLLLPAPLPVPLPATDRETKTFVVNGSSSMVQAIVQLLPEPHEDAGKARPPKQPRATVVRP
jgi:hypothetical protein